MDVLDEHHGGAFTDDPLEELDPRVLKAITGGEWMKPVSHVESKSEAQDRARSEAVEHHAWWVALQNAQMLLQHLGKRPVGDALPIREAPSRAP